MISWYLQTMGSAISIVDYWVVQILFSIAKMQQVDHHLFHHPA